MMRCGCVVPLLGCVGLEVWRASDTSGAKHKNAGLFPRRWPDVLFFALLFNPGDHFGLGWQHVAFGSRFYLEIDALEGGF